MSRCFVQALFAIAVSFTPSSNAAPIISDADLAASQFHVTFNEIVLPMGTVVTDQYAPFGVSFSTVTLPEYSESDFRYDVQGLGGTFHGIDEHYIGSSGANPVFIEFSSPVSAATFGMASNPRQFTISALLGGAPVESFSFFSSGGSFPQVNGHLAGYYGFQGITFDTIQILGALPNPEDNRVLLDNIRFDAVPEPTASSAILLLLAFGRRAVR